MKAFWMALVLSAIATSPLAQTEAGLGEWRGALSTPDGSLRLVVHISKANGVLSGAMDSPDQAGADGIPLNVKEAGPQRLVFEVPSIAAAYAGRWDEAAHGWSGQWSQSGAQLSLTLRRPDDASR